MELHVQLLLHTCGSISTLKMSSQLCHGINGQLALLTEESILSWHQLRSL